MQAVDRETKCFLAPLEIVPWESGDRIKWILVGNFLYSTRKEKSVSLNFSGIMQVDQQCFTVYFVEDCRNRNGVINEI